MKKIVIYELIFFIIFYIGLFIFTKVFWNIQTAETDSNLTAINKQTQNANISSENNGIVNISNDITDWKLILVNYQNSLPDNFEINLEYIDSTRKFDSRAIDELKQMLSDMKKSGLSNIWVQSAYRSVEYQKKLYDAKINYYIKLGNSREIAESLTLQSLNKPGTSEHNLGLAVDFNYINNDFEKTKEFEWLQQYAENYGFILRYKEEKKDITKVEYEPWHWRYVGVENAKKMNQLNMCLEEYIDYLKNS